jgi:hypothetical protein
MIFGKNPCKIQNEIKQLEQDMAKAQGVRKFAYLPVAMSDGRWVWLEDYTIFTRVFYDAVSKTINGKEITAEDVDNFTDGPNIMTYPGKEMDNKWYERVICKKSLHLMSERLDELKQTKEAGC